LIPTAILKLHHCISGSSRWGITDPFPRIHDLDSPFLVIRSHAHPENASYRPMRESIPSLLSNIVSSP
jgi:hypothetical protein